MIDDRHPVPQGHPTDAELIAWLDEPQEAASGTEASGAMGLARHVEDCDACRARLAELERLWAALRAEPFVPSDEALAGRWDAIMTAIEARPRQPARSTAPVTSPTVRPIRRWWWVPMAAAAAVAAFLLLSPERTVPPAPSGPDGTGQVLPVVAGAEGAAEEAFLEAADIQAALASRDAAAPVLTTEGSAIEEEFAALPAEDQEAILDELSTMTFEL